MEIFIALFLGALGVVLVIGAYRLYRRLMNRASQISAQDAVASLADVDVSGEVASDGIVYLYGHDFVRDKSSGPMVLPRDRAFAPLNDQELDPQDWALQLLYVPLAELHSQSAVEFRTVPREPTFLPPFPHKRWELEIIQRTPFTPSPVASAVEVAFELMRSRQQQRVAQGKEEPGELWCPLDEIIERAIKAMRQEIGFWERSGIFGDVRNYVASAMIASGYMIQPSRETWLDRARSKRPKPNVPAIDELRPLADVVSARLNQFRLKHGSPHCLGQAEPEEGEQQLVAATDPSLVTQGENFETMPLDDCLRISIYETLISLKQLEPSGGSGI